MFANNISLLDIYLPLIYCKLFAKLTGVISRSCTKEALYVTVPKTFQFLLITQINVISTLYLLSCVYTESQTADNN